MVDVPQRYAAALRNAANAIPMPYAVAACQINEESGFNPNAVSPAGAEGIAQFIPSTWAGWGVGSPFDPFAALTAYGKYMHYLLQAEGGNVRNALAAYNAGPGRIPAGWGYADTILSCAGQGINLVQVGLSVLGPEPLPGVPGPGNDDWSQKVRNSADQVHAAASNFMSAGKSIRSL